MYISSLFEYVTVCTAHCSNTRPNSCNECNLFLKEGNMVLEQGYCSPTEAFKVVSPRVENFVLVSLRVESPPVFSLRNFKAVTTINL